jgi:hypothetical protein
MANNLVREQIAIQIADHLMDLHDTSPSVPLENAAGSTCGSIVVHWRVQ